MGNIATLKPFKKGQSGNPAGKPKGTISLVTKMREALDKIHEGTDQPYHILLVQSMMKDAIKTDGQSRRLFLQYLEGMPKETKDIKLEIQNDEAKEKAKGLIKDYLGNTEANGE